MGVKWPILALFDATKNVITRQLLSCRRSSFVETRRYIGAKSSNIVCQSDVARSVRKSIFEQKTTLFGTLHVLANNFANRTVSLNPTSEMNLAGDFPSGMTLPNL